MSGVSRLLARVWRFLTGPSLDDDLKRNLQAAERLDAAVREVTRR